MTSCTTIHEQARMKGLADGDVKIFRELFEEYYPRVLAFVECIIKDAAEAEDIAQEIFAKIWERREIFDHVSSLNGYLFGMARNAALNSIRRSSRFDSEVQRIDIAERQSDNGSLEEEYYAREKELFIKLVVCRMPEQRRRIFEMSRYGGMDNDAIAKMLHLSKKTVENHLTLALKELRHALAAFSVLLFIH